ncbi:MAG: hypothetical protein GXY16_06280 [Syntrophomonadaceae bacterium]|nr:hypothetical protein [Syntrophomonadaceae bacterium]
MPLNTRTGRKIRESYAETAARGKTGKSLVNSLFMAVDDMLYEFGIISARPRKPSHRSDNK